MTKGASQRESSILLNHIGSAAEFFQSLQIWFQVNLMIELDLSAILIASAEDREVGVTIGETVNPLREPMALN
jgi:hypothetical protein